MKKLLAIIITATLLNVGAQAAMYRSTTKYTVPVTTTGVIYTAVGSGVMTLVSTSNLWVELQAVTPSATTSPPVYAGSWFNSEIMMYPGDKVGLRTPSSNAKVYLYLQNPN